MNANAWIALAGLLFTILGTVLGFVFGKIKAAYEKGIKETNIENRLDSIDSKLDNELEKINLKLDNALKDTISFSKYTEDKLILENFKANILQRVVALEKNVFPGVRDQNE